MGTATMANDDLMNIRRARLAEKWDRLQEQKAELVEQHRQQRNATSEAAARGDKYEAEYSDEQAENIEQEIQQIDISLMEMTPQGNQLTAQKLAYMAKHSEHLNRPHWSGALRADGRPASGLDVLAYGHDRAIAMGLEEESPAYWAALDVLAPTEGGSTIPSPDEAARISGVDPRTYNNQVRRIISERRKGIRRD
jgi:hypothetical protein